MSDAYYAADLLRRWDRGLPAAVPAPLAVRSRWYRRIVGEVLRRSLPAGRPTLLSLGSGTGRMEVALERRGFDVIASDVSPSALGLCRAAGLEAVYCDILSPPITLGTFDALYADGLVGHLGEVGSLGPLWRNCRALTDGHLLLSNDLSDEDGRTDRAVHGNDAARFVRPPAGAFARSAAVSGLWQEAWSRILTYRRPGRGLRRRELLLLCAVTDERRDGRAAC